MKRFSFLMAALLVAMTGCQKEPQVTENGSDAQTVGYVSLKISLPSTVGTKAVTEEFDEGSKNEYNVKDATVIFYDKDGKYVYHKSVDAKPWKENNNNQINVTGKTEAIKIESNANIVKKALVLINSANFFTDDDFKKNFNALAKASVVDKPYALRGLNSDEFFMSNAPFYTADGKFENLVDVTVANDAEAALANPATIKVERAAAKVRLTAVYGGNADSWMLEGAETFEARLKGWNLSMTNYDFYVVRNGYDKSNITWFDAQGNPINAGLLGSRINFAVDPNYNEQYATTPSDFKVIQEDELMLENEAYIYCTENTSAIESMRENQTTTAIIKVYMVPTRLRGDNKSWFRVGLGKTVMTLDELAEMIETKLDEGNMRHPKYPTDELKAKLSEKAGKVEINELDCERGISLEELIGEVECYKDGMCYYSVKIRHFNDEELGYDEVDTFLKSYAANSGYVAKDLGRYGVVRNNYYEITISGVSAPGSPTLPTPDDVPNDELEQYVSCSIDVLAWSKRQQSVVLK